MKSFKTTLEVTGLYRENRRCYFTVTYDDTEYKIPMWKFQMDNPEKPRQLECIVRRENGRTSIIQDSSVLRNAIYQIGGTYPFRVKSVYKTSYLMIDSNGLIFKLRRTAGMTDLMEGMSVTCKVISLDSTQGTLQLVMGEAAREGVGLEEAADAIGLDESQKEVFVNCFTLVTCDDEVNRLYVSHDWRWMLEGVARIDEMFSLKQSQPFDAELFLPLFRKFCFFLLEESPLLKSLGKAERTEWLHRLNVIAQHAQDFEEAYELLSKGEERKFIDQQLSNLSQSEYLYQPERKFRIMMSLFTLNEGLMPEVVDRIFEIILGGNKEHWKEEPFRTAFVDMLEVFISRYRYTATRNAGSGMVEKTVKAIAIQLLLADSTDNIDRRLNQAALYRLMSYNAPWLSHDLLTRAFHSLFAPFKDDNEEMEYDWDDINANEGIITRLSTSAWGSSIKSFQPQVFRTDSLELKVSEERVTVQRTDGRPESILPADTLKWRKFSLKAHKRLTVYAKDPENINALAKVWKEAEENLEVKPAVAAKKTLPSVGDHVNLRVTDISENFDAFYCEIDDPLHFGEGWLPLHEVVKYLKPIEANYKYFEKANEQGLLFEAKVIKDDPEDMEFSMLDIVDAYFEDLYMEGQDIVCNIRDRDKVRSNAYIGVTREGASCVVYVPDNTLLGKGDTVQGTLRQFNVYGQAELTYGGSSAEHFNPGAVFGTLVEGLAFENEEEAVVAEEPMDRATVMELVCLLDRQASASEERPQAFGFLSLASIISRMLGDRDLHEYYSKRKELVQLFHEYEKNGFVDAEKVEALTDTMDEEAVKSDYQVNEALTKIKILESLRHKEHIPTLLTIREETRNERIRNAADLAISLLLTRRFELPNMQRILEDRINQELGVKVRASNLKDYGMETQQKEFKSSMVFPPDNRMLAFPERQGTVIMQTICGFLNSDKGGTLYLGVNNAGAACGIDNDLIYLKMDEDAYGCYVHGWIARELGHIANQCCLDCTWETDRGYKVYVMKINPAPDLVKFRGRYWIRQDTQKRPLAEDAVATFRKMHASAYERFLQESGQERPVEEPEAPAQPCEGVKEEAPAAAAAAPETTSSAEEATGPRIATSGWRVNPVDMHDPAYGTTDAVAYLHFLSDNSYKITDDGIYEDVELSLAITEKETGGWILMAFESGNVLLSETEKLLKKKRNRNYPMTKEDRLIFAAPLLPDDALLTFWETSRGDRTARLDTLEELCERHCDGQMTKNGAPLTGQKFNAFLRCEVIPADLRPGLKRFSNSGDNLGQRLPQPGTAEADIFTKLKLD